ncbi:MAG: methionine synthase [Methanobacteriaceae archaeon]|jgi:5-methyltetrahydropteroyltriglutamate--homocysteine methyltransferase|nr:methionine synthase [Methanobacteriaceae archaeon]
MFTSVVGSFPVEIKSPDNIKDKILNFLSIYDPYKKAIEDIVNLQLDAGIDIISDGQLRGDMILSFSKYIPGFKTDMNSSVIVSKIQKPYGEITTKDIKYAKSILEKHPKNSKEKSVKAVLTGPSTIVHSSRIESFYKNKEKAILDLAKSLKFEVEALDELNVKYIQIDEPFLSTGMVDLKTASKAISILRKNIKTPIAIHVCGNLTDVFKELVNFDVDIIDCEFAGNDYNLDLLEKYSSNLKNKKIGFGCLDTTLNDVDDYQSVKNMVSKAVDLIGSDNLILDPDCGLRKVDLEIAYKKLEIISKIKEEYD